MLLSHERLLCLGGPLHARTVAVTRGAHIYMCCAPERVGLGDYGGTLAGPYTPGPAMHYRYRRLKVQFDANVRCEILVVDGYRLDAHSIYTDLAENGGAGIVLALSGGVVRQRNYRQGVWRTPHWVAAIDEATNAIAAFAAAWNRPDDTWSAEARADDCWRCDATSSTTDVGLCDTCLVDLRDAA